jgi:hypothetical protein
LPHRPDLAIFAEIASMQCLWREQANLELLMYRNLKTPVLTAFCGKVVRQRSSFRAVAFALQSEAVQSTRSSRRGGGWQSFDRRKFIDD